MKQESCADDLKNFLLDWLESVEIFNEYPLISKEPIRLIQGVRADEKH